MRKVLIAMVLGVVFIFAVAKQPYGISYVLSNSIAKGYYFSTKQPPGYSVALGEIVCVRIEQPDWVQERQYLPKGLPICKKVVAIEGDFIRVQKEEIHISRDGKQWSRLAAIQSKDSKGREIKHYPWGESTKLQSGEFFAFGDNNQMSLDSRYLGPIKTNKIEKTLKELYVFRSNIQQ